MRPPEAATRGCFNTSDRGSGAAAFWSPLRHSEIWFDAEAQSPMVSRWMPRIQGRQEVARLTLFTIAPAKTRKPLLVAMMSPR
jgi:hypothetical protein